MNWETISGILRHVLTFGGGFMVSAGIATESDVTTGTSALVTIIGIVWSVVAKIRAARALEAAKAAPAEPVA